MVSIQPLPFADRRPLLGVNLPRPPLASGADFDPERTLAS
jgi:hypothetical protein